MITMMVMMTVHVLLMTGVLLPLVFSLSQGKIHGGVLPETFEKHDSK